ncbi:MAG: tyrosine-type recombinase/integrase, partial [Clostridiales Family XIII bacterium]|nr:tyrosine-type recombinase/integrase [Clostridiales Family XIII bacterium]
MDSQLEQFKEYLESAKKMAANSVAAYMRDAGEFVFFLTNETDEGARGPESAGQADVAAYLLKLKQDGKSAATVRRKLASVRAFYRFLQSSGGIKANPAGDIKTPKAERKDIDFLSVEEMEKLIEQPDKSAKGVRDRAILELLYAAGLRISEAVELDVESVNLRMGFVTCAGGRGKTRIIPLGRPARTALEEYIYGGRAKLLRSGERDEPALFLNCHGGRMTRQGIWKTLNEYAERAGFERKVAPQIIRNSFAVHMVQNGADLKSLQEMMGH